jgi:hypothetical protein
MVRAYLLLLSLMIDWSFDSARVDVCDGVRGGEPPQEYCLSSVGKEYREHFASGYIPVIPEPLMEQRKKVAFDKENCKIRVRNYKVAK